MNEALIKELIVMFETMVAANEALVAKLKAALPFATTTSPAEEKPKRGRKVATATEVAKIQEAGPMTATEAVAGTAALLAEVGAVKSPVEDAAVKVAEVIKKAEPTPHAEGGALTVGDVTIEMIRARATEFSNTTAGFFDMLTWSALAQKITGAKSVKAIKPEVYGLFYATMGDWVDKMKAATTDEAKKAVRAALIVYLEGKTLPGVTAGSLLDTSGGAHVAVTVTLDQVKQAAAAYMSRNGEPALVKLKQAFSIVKFSEMPAEKYASFIEACQNA